MATLSALLGEDSSSETGSDFIGSNGREVPVDELSLAVAAIVTDVLLVFADGEGSSVPFAADGSAAGGGTSGSSAGSVLISSAASGIKGNKLNLLGTGASLLFGTSSAFAATSCSAGTLAGAATGCC